MFVLSGRIEKQAIDELRRLFELQTDYRDIVLDLKDVGVIHRDVVPFLVSWEADGWKERKIDGGIGVPVAHMSFSKRNTQFPTKLRIYPRQSDAIPCPNRWSPLIWISLSCSKGFDTGDIETQLVVEGGHMPLVRVDLVEGKSEEYREKVGEIVYQTLVDILSVPKHDRFQVIAEHRKSGLSFDRDYLGIHRSDECIFLQITLNSGRSIELKQRFYKALADGLHQGVKLRKEDVFINLVEVPKENWSFGNGEAQYAK